MTSASQTTDLEHLPKRDNKETLRGLGVVCLALFAGTCAVGVSPMQGAFIAAFVCWFVWGLVAPCKERRPPSPLLWPILTLIGVNLLVAVFAIDPTASLKGVKQLFMVSVVFVVGDVIARKGEIRLLCVAWIASGAVAGLYAVGQHVSGEMRAAGFFGGPATLARVLVPMAVVASAVALAWRESRWRVFYACCVPIIILAVALTMMRGGWLALFVATGVLSILLRSKAILAAILTALLLVVAIAMVSPQGNAGSLIRSMIHPLDSSSARFATSNLQRYWTYRAAWNVFCDHPLLGVGQRNFSRAYGRYIPEELRSPDRDQRHEGKVYTRYSDAHNLYLNLLATQGLLGLGGFLYLVVAACRLTWCDYRRQQDAFLRSLSAGIFAAIIGFLVFGLTIENSRDSESIMQLWFLMGMTVAIHWIGSGDHSAAGPNQDASLSNPARIVSN